MTLPDLPIPPELACDNEPLTDDQLDEYVAERLTILEDPDSAGVPHRWTITDDGAAEWALRRIAVIDAERADLNEKATAWRDRIQAWFDHATTPLDQRRDFFVFHLERYAYEQREATGRKTLTFPSGKVASRESKPAAIVVDEAAVIAWANANLPGELLESVVRTVVSVSLTGLRDVVTIDADREKVLYEGGELVPGTDVRPGAVSFTVTAS